MMRVFKTVVVVLILVSSLIATACGDGAAYAEARDMERKLLMANPEANYADPAYLRVAQKLTEVPRASDDFDKSQQLLGKIQDARRIQAGEAFALSHHPKRLEGVTLAQLKPMTEGVAPAQPKVVEVAARPAPVQASEPALVAKSDGEYDPVIMYATSWCGYCKKARSYFKRNNIDFIEKDIEKDRVAAREMQAKVGGRSGVPVIDIDGKVIRGFDLPGIKRALAARN